MVSVGKYLACVMICALLLFFPVAAFLPQFIDKFTTYALGILGIVTAGVVVYIVVKLKL